MGRAAKDSRRAIASLTGIPTDDKALLRAAIPADQQAPLAQTIKQRGQQVRAGIPRRPPL